MSEENVEIIRQFYDTLNRDGVAAAAELLHPDIEIHEPPEVPDADVWHGRDGVEEVVGKLASSFHDLAFEADEIIPIGNRVFVIVRWSGRGSSSGAEADTALFHLWSFRDGQPIWLDAYLNETAALEAAGLSE